MSLTNERFRAEVIAVVSVSGGEGVIEYRTAAGEVGTVDVIAEGWGDGFPSYWPPGVGDVVEIIVRPVVIMKSRKR